MINIYQNFYLQEEEIALKEEKKKAEMRKKVETKIMVIEAV
jgi:hypothetical protein